MITTDILVIKLSDLQQKRQYVRRKTQIERENR